MGKRAAGKGAVTFQALRGHGSGDPLPIRAANEVTGQRKKLKAEMGKTEIAIRFNFCFLYFSFYLDPSLTFWARISKC